VNLQPANTNSPITFIDVFERLEAGMGRYVVVGGVAVVLHGHERPVLDLDIVIDPTPVEADRVMRMLMSAGFVPSIPLPLELVTVLRMFDSSFREIDVFVRFSIPFEELWKDAKRAQVADQAVRIASSDHMIQLAQFNGRPHDLEDIEGLKRIGN
jgi:hypothetical protein